MTDEGPGSSGGDDAKKENRRFWVFVAVSAILWLSAILARGAINIGWHEAFFEIYSIVVLGPYAAFCLVYLGWGWLRRRRRR